MESQPQNPIESQPQNPEFRNNPENFHPCKMDLDFVNSACWVIFHDFVVRLLIFVERLLIFFKVNIVKKFFQEYTKGMERLFANFISRQHKSPLARKGYKNNLHN